MAEKKKGPEHVPEKIPTIIPGGGGTPYNGL